MSNHTLPLKFAKVGFAVWCLWFVVRVSVFALNLPGWGTSWRVWQFSVGDILSTACVCVLAGVLAWRPNKQLAIALAIFSVWSIWRGYVNALLFPILFQSRSVSEVISTSWTVHAGRPERLVLWLVPLALLSASAVFYPIYGLTAERDAV